MHRNRALAMQRGHDTSSVCDSQWESGRTPSKSNVAVAAGADIWVAITYRHTVKKFYHVQQLEETRIRTFPASQGRLQRAQWVEGRRRRKRVDA